MIVSTKCQELALVLQTMSTKISFQDTETATTQLIESTTNILSVRQFRSVFSL